MADDTPGERPAVLALTPAIDWLLREAALVGGLAALLAGLAERLVAEGLPAARVTLSVRASIRCSPAATFSGGAIPAASWRCRVFMALQR